MDAVNGIELVLIKGSEVIAIGKASELILPESSLIANTEFESKYESKEWSMTIEPSSLDVITTMMEYYYHRGNKYFFRNDKDKLMVQTDEIIPKMKYGESCQMTIQY